ncbi:uncharacterized protein LOC120326264 [Styela clava]
MFPFTILLLTFSSTWLSTCCMKLSDAQKKCYVNSTYYEEGETFGHTFKGSPCKFECTCVIRKIKNLWIPTGACVHRCPPMSYPPGCEPVSDECCARSYICPDGEKCQDKETGMMYAIGETWERTTTDSSCECTCFGERVGRHQCKCIKTVPINFMEEEYEVEPTKIPCEEDDSQSCSACPLGMTTCPIRGKCERWPYMFEGIGMECTCYGSEGTRCASKREEDRRRDEEGEVEKFVEEEKNRRKRSQSVPSVIELYIYEDQSKTVEPSYTRINKDARTFPDEN